MDVNNMIKLFVALVLFTTSSGCNQNRNSIRHGNVSYQANDVFGDNTLVLHLAIAAAQGNVAEIDKQIGLGANVNTVGKYEITPLWWAAWAENYQGFAKLLEKGANPNLQRTERYPIMLLVAEIKDPRFLEVALKHGADPNLRDNKTGETPIFPAVLHGYTNHIDLLLAAKADVNVQLPVSGETLPMVAMVRRDYRLIYRLFEHGASPSLSLTSGETLVDIIEVASKNASNNDDPWRKKVLELLREKGVTARNPTNK